MNDLYGYDRITDFDFSQDKIDLPGAVSGFANNVDGGQLSSGSFDADLAAALDPSHLGAGQAVFYNPDSGDLAGQHFLVVDANGQAGYQAGQDYVIHPQAGEGRRRRLSRTFFSPRPPGRGGTWLRGPAETFFFPRALEPAAPLMR